MHIPWCFLSLLASDLWEQNFTCFLNCWILFILSCLKLSFICCIVSLSPVYFTDPNDNSVNIADRKTKESLEEALQRKITMKKDKRNVKEGYMKLEHLVASLPASKPTFKDSRVHKLWALALKTNWTEEELNGFKVTFNRLFSSRNCLQGYQTILSSFGSKTLFSPVLK